MTTLILVRHGLTAVTGRVLSGRLPGHPLDDRGRAQATAVADRLRAVPLAAIVSSPVERCAATAQAIAAGRGPDGEPDPVIFDDRLAEVDYGEWAGRELRDLAREPLWRVVQATPSAVTFPGGETLRAMSARAVEAVRAGNAAAGPDATWLACTHGDLVKAILADALGLHLDAYQRIAVGTCSISVVRYAPDGSALVSRVNDTGAALDDLVPRPHGHRRGNRGTKRRD